MQENHLNSMISSIAHGVPVKAYTQGKKATEIWTPYNGSQDSVYNSTADIVGYGGEAGGGKTDTAFGLAYYKHKRSILFRAELSQMENEIIPRGNEVYDGVARFIRGHRMCWEFDKGGMLALGALKNKNDYSRYRGSSWDCMFFDEAPNIRQDEVMSVMGWARSKEDIKTQIFMYFNPPTTAEGEWIIEYFAPWLDKGHQHPAESGEKRWVATIDNKETFLDPGAPTGPFMHGNKLIIPESRTFYRSYLDDNPNFGPEYRARLENLLPPLNKQLAQGDFQVGLEDDAWQLFQQHVVNDSLDRWIPMEIDPSQLTAVGVDVARGGRNQTIIAKRYGDWVAPLIKIDGEKTPTGGHVAKAVMDELDDPDVPIYIDALGVGTSPYDSLVAAGCNVYGINLGQVSDNTDSSGMYQMGNVRADLFWMLMESLSGHPIFLNIPKDEQLRRELLSIRYLIQSGKVYIEKKEDLIKRIGRSTDCADALALCAMGRYFEYRV